MARLPRIRSGAVRLINDAQGCVTYCHPFDAEIHLVTVETLSSRNHLICCVYLELHKLSKSKQGQTRSQLFFVVRLAPNNSQYKSGQRIEIQILDSRRRAKFVGYAGETEKELLVEGYSVPYVVLEAARRQHEGQGDYVNEEGEIIPAF